MNLKAMTQEEIRRAWLAPYSNPTNYMLDATHQPEKRTEMFVLAIGGRTFNIRVPQRRVYSYNAVSKALTCWGLSRNVVPAPRFIRQYLPPLLNGPATQPKGQRHRRLRELFDNVISGSAVAALRPRVFELASRLVREVAEQNKAFAFNKITDEVTYFAICELLGVDEKLRRRDQRERFFAWVDELTEATSAFNLSSQKEAVAFFNDYIDTRLKQSLNEPIDRLLQCEELGKHEIIAQLLLDFVSATVTTSHAICSAIAGAVSMEDREKFETIRRTATGNSNEATKVLTGLYHEALRYAGPTRLRPFIVYWPCRLDGTWYWPGQVIEVCFASANRDAIFTNPHDFNPERSLTPKHLAFGAEVAGIESYMCPGRGLSAIIARAVLGAWFEHMANWDIFALEFYGELLLRPRLELMPPSKF